jgi:ATP-dependent DNA helicase RecG
VKFDYFRLSPTVFANYGAKQSGLFKLRIANIVGDALILQEAREEAFRLVEADPGLRRPEHRLLSDFLQHRYADLILATVG